MDTISVLKPVQMFNAIPGADLKDVSSQAITYAKISGCDVIVNCDDVCLRISGDDTVEEIIERYVRWLNKGYKP